MSSLIAGIFTGESPFHVLIPDGVTTIDNFAFYNCAGLTSLL